MCISIKPKASLELANSKYEPQTGEKFYLESLQRVNFVINITDNYLSNINLEVTEASFIKILSLKD